MIDWAGVVANSIWAIGLAVALAVFSHQDWRGSYHREGLWATIRQVAHNPAFAGGLILTCLGAGLSVMGWAERILWFLLAAALAFAVGWAALWKPRGPLQ